MKLLDLPDELLSPIILEAMWATTTKPSNRPDLLMYERRLTNHPSLERKRVAFVGHICGRMRRIAQPLLQPTQLWHAPGARVEFDHNRVPLARDTPSSLINPSIRAIACLGSQAVFLPQLPSASLERLTDLSLSGAIGTERRYVECSVLRSIGSCKQLQHLAIDGVFGSFSGITKLFADIASIPMLRTVVAEAVYPDARPTHPLSLALSQTWSAALIRLELVYCTGISLSGFVQLMGKVAATLQVAIFYTDYQTSRTLESTTAIAASFSQLWRLDIGLGFGAHPRYRGRFAAEDSTEAGRQQLAWCSPIAVWKAAPRLAYLACSERIVVKTQKELDEISELRKRDGMKSLRIKLETWEGDKGAGWSTDKIQKLFVG